MKKIIHSLTGDYQLKKKLLKRLRKSFVPTAVATAAFGSSINSTECVLCCLLFRKLKGVKTEKFWNLRGVRHNFNEMNRQ